MSGGDECSYLADINKLSSRSQNVLYFYLGGTIACPRCSRPKQVVYHQLNYNESEDEKNEEMAST